MKLYFSHPTFTFNTKTEKKCIKIILEHLEVEELINPADYGLKESTKDKLRKADGVVGMAIGAKFTYLVWKEMEINGNEENFYTFMVEGKKSIGPLVEGVPEKIKKLSKEESNRFANKITKEDYKEGFMNMLFGGTGGRF